MKKRILSIVLSIVMLVSLLPTTALALETPAHAHDMSVDCGGSGVTFEPWDGTGTFPGGNVYLTKDITLTEALTISGTVNLCLNGHSITHSGIRTITVSEDATLNICDCGSGGSVTNSGSTYSITYGIYNSGIYNSGTVNVYGGTVESSYYGIYNEGTLTVYGGSVAGTGDRGIFNMEGTVNVYGGTVSGYIFGILNYGGTVNVTDGTVTATDSTGYGIDNDYGTVNVYGGNIGVVTSNIRYGIRNEGGTVYVYGGTVSGYWFGITNSGGTVNVTDGTVTATFSSGIGISNRFNGTVTVSGGTVTATGDDSYGIENYNFFDGTTDVDTTVNVSGTANVSGGYYGIYNRGNLTVSGGTVTATGSNGFGIYNFHHGAGSLELSGAPTITGATAGVYLDGGSITLGGAPTITGTIAGVYLEDGSITLGGALTYVEERAIRVRMVTPGTFTSGWTTKMGGNAANYGSYFTSANYGYTVQPDGNELKLARALTGVSAKGYSGRYDGNAHGITVTVPDGATVEYGTTEGVYTAARPTYTDAGSYTVYYKVTKDGFAPVIGSAVVSISKINPSYELPMGVTATYGDTLEDIKISDWGSGWSWKEPTTSVGDVGAKTFVAVFTPTDTNNYKSIEVDITVTVNHAEPGYNPPTAKQDLVYSGIEKELVNKGTATGGSMQYALGADGTTAPASGWSTYVPVGRDAGTYYIWYKVVGDENHNDVAPACVAVTIAKKEIGISWSNTALTYNGAAQQPTATATGVVTGEQIALLLSAPETNAGSYTATAHSIDGATAQNYKLPTNKSTSFTIEQQALTILWGNGTFTYDSTEKFPAFNVEGIWNADDVQVTKAGAQTNAGEYTAQITGLTGSDAGNYKLTGTLTKDFVINKADQAAPAVNKADETISGKNDGKITDVTANMEYRAEGEDRYTAITGESVENLADGKYYVRVKGDSNHNPSADTAVVIGAGRMLTVTVPQNQVGYTMTVDKSTAAYGEAVKVTFALNDGYSAADGFAVKLNGSAITLSNGEYTVANTTEDLAFTVEGVADITAPLAQIDIKNNKWTSFWNGVTFGLFFNETQDVTVTATDTGSGVNAIQYYLASGELELEEVKQIPVWQDYNGTFQIDPDNAYVVYVKVTDNAGNVSYLNSDGVVLDQTVPVLVGIENGEDYYGDKIFKALDDYLDTLKVDGVDVTDEMNGDNEYTIVADNAEHIVTVTDKAGNVTEYRITVYKNYTVTYKVDGNTVSTQTVGHGKDATASSIPTKDGYTQTTPAWDKDGTNITADTEINAVYTINEYTITFMDENGVYKTLTVKHGEAVTMPEVPAKDGYTVTWDTTNEKATDNATVNAVYTKNAVSDNPPQTGDNSNLWLWWILLIVSAFGITVICIEQKKRKTMR